DWYPGSESDFFWGQYNRPYNHIPKWHLKEGVIWDKDHPNSFLPKYTGFKAQRGTLNNPQTRYLMNVAYIRLKNLKVGYNFSSKKLSKVGIKEAQIYINGINLWEYTPLQKTAPNIDPENGIRIPGKEFEGGFGPGLNYPMLEGVSLGVSLMF